MHKNKTTVLIINSSVKMDTQLGESSSDSSDGEGSVVREILALKPELGRGDGASTPEAEKSKPSWLKRLTNPAPHRPSRLSIQSGDIVRSPTPGSQGSVSSQCTSPISPAPVAAPGARPRGNGQAQGVYTAPAVAEVSTNAADGLMSGTRPPLLVLVTEAPYTPYYSPEVPESYKSKGFVYTTLFRVVYVLVRTYFYSLPVGRCRLPIVSLLLLIFNAVVIIAIAFSCAFSSYTPTINVSIKSFGIPNHPAQVNWDAFNAGLQRQFTNSTTEQQPPSDEPPLNYPSEGQLRKKRSALQARSIAPECSSIYATQYALHRNWEMDLVFRVPDSNADSNILTRDRISYIHSVEELIYNSTEYKNFCHKPSSSPFCDPLLSLLTWLYPRDPVTGKYIYDTADGFTPDLPGTMRTLSEDASKALWFTAGELSINDTSVEAKLLRSQIRVGLPLPCFKDTHDRYDEQKDLVTEYFASLMPVLEEMSTSEVEVLYGGPIMFDYQVWAATMHDIILACISLGLVLSLMLFLSGGSLWLTITGFYAIASCFVPAYFVYRAFFKIETIGLLNVISIFVVIGIGVDDVFVFINTFKQSSRLPDLKTDHERITHTILEATKATFFTSVTTAAAFFANAVSSIPAVQQFGIFMGLVVMFCFVQVLLVVPHSLQIWNCFFVKLENLFYLPLYWVLCKARRSRYTTLSAQEGGGVRMSNLVRDNDDDDDSGINSVSSASVNSDSISNDSSQSDTTPLVLDSHEDATPLEDGVGVAVVKESLCDVIARYTSGDATFERRLTELMQKGMFFISVLPMAFHLVFNKYKARTRNKATKATLTVAHVLTSLGILCVVVALSIGLMMQLRFSNKPPQFFDPDSNIQKMLDLAGNVTDTTTSSCLDCSAWSSPNVPIPTSGSNTGGGGGGGGSSSPATSTPTHRPPTPSTTPSKATPTTPTNTPSTHPTPSTSTPRVTTPSRPTEATPSNGNGGSSGVTTKPTTPTTRDDGAPTPAPTDHISASRYSSNADVFVVFGIKGVERNYDPSHVLQESGDQNLAVLDTSFSDLLSCPYAAQNAGRVKGTLRALCRICANISDPEKGLSLEGNHQCLTTSAISGASCMRGVISTIPECAVLYQIDATKVSVSAKANVTGGKVHYLAMAFKSTTNLGNSPFQSIKDYQKWNDFLNGELNDIQAKSAEGELYEGAQVLSSAFQTSEYWVEVNIQIVAVDGSFYGILLSFVLCSIAVVILAHDYRIVISMVVTIVTILLSLGGLFWCFGWKLGIVEAISLSILVGNSLDYCIHLSEGYVAMDTRHIAFVESFKIAAPMRVKRVMAAISFIGVSIFSSAITTILAILPLVGTRIQLFARFGEILLLDTAVAIVYTLIICSNCLGFFGPPLSEKRFSKVLNAVLTVGITFGFYIVLIIVLGIASSLGVYIPSPQGGALFG